jgi:acetolactate synthase-1/2/3 large subunit
MVKISDAVADFLKYHEIDTVFGIIGSANSHIFDSINKLGYTKIINVHHEQAAVLAMGAYYRASGKLSAAIVTAGAGATNAVTGIVSNWADSIPGIIISGQESSFYVRGHKDLRMYGTQGLNISKMVEDVTKYSVLINEDSNIQNELEKSLNITLEGRPGPVCIDIPFNLQSKLIDFRPWTNKIEESHKIYDISELKDLINNSSRPVLVGGNGIRLSNSKNSFNTLVNELQIPTLLTWSGIDLLSNDNPYFFGRFGLYGQRAANFIVQNCDLLIVLGSRLALPQVGYDFTQFARASKIVIVDIDELESSKYKVHLHIKENCKDIIQSLLNSNISGQRKDWLDHCNELRLKYPWVGDEHQDNGYLNSYRFIDSLSKHLKDNHIIVTDMGTALLSGHQAIKLTSNQTMFTSLGLGEMGYGLPGALGAALACPEKPVLCLNCDGGIMMNLQELHTIIENQIPMKIIIFNNDGYLMIKQTQKLLFNKHYVSVDKNTGIGLPNFNKLMPAFGYSYYDLKTWDNFESIIEAFLNDPGAAALEVFMDPEQDFIPKVKGVLKEDNSILAPPIEEMSPLLSYETIQSEMIIGISEKSKQIKR